MGDFMMYYQKNGTTSLGLAVCTHDLDNEYIQARLGRFRKAKLADDEVLLWNWQFNCPLKISVNRIKRMTPLGAVLKNHR